MGQQAIDVLTRWIAETVHAVPADSLRKEADRLVTEFTAYATDAGISVERLEEDIGEDILSYMRSALEAASQDASDALDD